MKKHRTYQIDRRYFHFVGKPCWAHWAHSSSHSGSSWRDSRERACHPHWHCRTHGSSCRPGWTDLQPQQLHQPLVHGRAYRKSARRNGLLLYQRVEHWQGRVETLTTWIYLGEIRDRFFFFTWIYLGEIRDRFFFFLPKYLNII